MQPAEVAKPLISKRNADEPSAVPGEEQEGEDLVWPPANPDSNILWLESLQPATARDAGQSPSPAAVQPFAPTTLNLRVLLSPDAAVEWHDAIAIVQQIAEETAARGTHATAGAIPALDAIVLEPDGRVRATLDPTDNEPFVPGLAKVLQALLHGRSAPPNLRSFVHAMASGPDGTESLERWTTELARWERPGRTRKLVSVYERNRHVTPPPPTPVTPPPPTPVTPPREPALASPAQAAPPAVAARDGSTTLDRRRVPLSVLAVAAFGSIIGGGIVTLLLMHRSIPYTTTRSDGGSGWQPAVVDQPAAQSRVLTTDIELPTSMESRIDDEHWRGERATPQAENHVVHRPSTPSTPANGRARDMDTPAIEPAIPAAPPGSAAPNVARSKPDGSSPVSASARSPLYRTGDEGVQEPVLLNHSLPSQGTRQIDPAVGMLELVVDTRGRVESVRLNSRTSSYRDKWWLFTAKSWQFEPATKDGKPVRFLKRIPLDALNAGLPR
jgi:hypothetical protein